MFARDADHDPGALVEREAADARPEGGQGKGLAAELVGELKAGDRRPLDQVDDTSEFSACSSGV